MSELSYTRPRYMDLTCSKCGKHICYAYTVPEVSRNKCESDFKTDVINDGKHYVPYMLYCPECEEQFRLELESKKEE